MLYCPAFFFAKAVWVAYMSVYARVSPAITYESSHTLQLTLRLLSYIYIYIYTYIYIWSAYS